MRPRRFRRNDALLVDDHVREEGRADRRRHRGALRLGQVREELRGHHGAGCTGCRLGRLQVGQVAQVGQPATCPSLSETAMPVLLPFIMPYLLPYFSTSGVGPPRTTAFINSCMCEEKGELIEAVNAARCV